MAFGTGEIVMVSCEQFQSFLGLAASLTEWPSVMTDPQERLTLKQKKER